MKNPLSALRRTVLAAAFTVLLPVAPAMADPAAEIPVYVPGELDANGNPLPGAVLIIDIVNHLAAESGLNLVAHAYPWRRAQMLAENGGGLLYGAAATAERRRTLNFSKPLYFVNQWLVASARNPVSFKHWEDLRGKVISIPGGSRYSAEFEAHRNKTFMVEENSTTIKGRLQMLSAGRVDAVLMDTHRSASQLEARLNCRYASIGKWSIAEKAIETEPVLISVSKSSPLNSIFPVLNDAIDRLEKSHGVQKLLEKSVANSNC